MVREELFYCEQNQKSNWNSCDWLSAKRKEKREMLKSHPHQNIDIFLRVGVSVHQLHNIVGSRMPICSMPPWRKFFSNRVSPENLLKQQYCTRFLFDAVLSANNKHNTCRGNIRVLNTQQIRLERNKTEAEKRFNKTIGAKSVESFFKWKYRQGENITDSFVRCAK